MIGRWIRRTALALGTLACMYAQAAGTVGQPNDFSQSASLRGARQIDLVGQGAFDPILGTGHLGILNSPQTWTATLEFLGAAPAGR